jgi:pyridoxamine 5'-phosphate oxidase
MRTPMSTSTPGPATARSAPLFREELDAAFRQFAEAHPGEVPRPPYWRGFRVHAEQIEFWISGDYRLHNRFLFTRDAGSWKTTRLYP